jgi:hypothetical protein
MARSLTAWFRQESVIPVSAPVDLEAFIDKVAALYLSTALGFCVLMSASGMQKRPNERTPVARAGSDVAGFAREV